MVRSLYLYGAPGATSVTDGRLAYVNVIGVKRNGLGQEEASSSPGNAQFVYTGSEGKISFDPTNPFAGPPFGRPNPLYLEKIFVLYKSAI